MITDRKIPKTYTVNSIFADYYDPVVLSATDYFPFGMEMPGRTMAMGGYRYGFNGKEKDTEGEWGTQTHYDYGFRIYESGIGRFLSVDPLMKEYPELTPYQFVSNSPVRAIDIDGLEGADWDEYFYKNLGSTELSNEQPSTFDLEGAVKGTLTGAKGFLRSISPVSLAEPGDPKNLKESWQLIKSMPANLLKLPKVVANVLENGTTEEKFSTIVGLVAVIKTGKVKNPKSLVVAGSKVNRKLLATNFLAQMGKNASEVQQILKTFDFSRSVKFTKLNKGAFVWRYERSLKSTTASEKHFFTDAYAADVGAQAVGFEASEGYKLVKYKVTKETTVLEGKIRGTKHTQYISDKLQNNIKKVSE